LRKDEKTLIMKKILIVLNIILILFFINCKKETNEEDSTQKNTILNDPMGEEITDYIVNNMRPITESLDNVMSDFSTVSTNYADSYGGLLTAIEKDIIPKFSQIIKKLEKVNPKTEELRNIHQIFVRVCKDMLSGLELLKKGLKNENPDLMTEANDKLTKAGNDLETYKEKLTALSKKHNVDHLLSSE